jgi:hypothetical protein
MHIPLPLQTNDTQCNEGFHTSEKPKLDNASVMHKQSHRLKFRYLVFYRKLSQKHIRRDMGRYTESTYTYLENIFAYNPAIRFGDILTDFKISSH